MIGIYRHTRVMWRDVLFVTAELLFAGIPLVGLSTLRPARLRLPRLVSSLSGIVAFALLTVLFVDASSPLGWSLCVVNLCLRVVELSGLVYCHLRTRRLEPVSNVP